MFYQALPVQMQTGPAGLRMLLAARLKLLDKGPAAGFVLLNEDSAAGLVTGIRLAEKAPFIPNSAAGLVTGIG